MNTRQPKGWRRRRWKALCGAALVALSAAGCATHMRDRELAAVAKDWCMVLRASQVIPVYPLTQDLVPGDVFLVQLPVDRQHEAFDDRGFLPLDNHIGRVPMQGVPPDMTTIAHAAFPTYAFSVRRGAGLSLALPVQGIPVALGLMGTGAAEGSIAIGDARTYGFDAITLHAGVAKWSRAHQEFLSHFAPHEEQLNYIRVISRVYLAGRVGVSLAASEERAAGVSGGAAPPLELLTPGLGQDPGTGSLERYEENLDTLNSAIAKALGGGALPGATVKVVSASARAIALDETFPQPLVFGYLGFDMAIGAHGILGPPIPTHAVLTAQMEPSAELARVTTSSLRTAYAAWQERARQGDPGAVSMVSELDGLARMVPRSYPCDIMGQRAPGGPLSAIFEEGASIPSTARDFATLTTYQGRLSASIDAIERALAGGASARVVDRADGRELSGPEAAAYLGARLQENRTSLERLTAELDRHRALLRAAVSTAVTP